MPVLNEYAVFIFVAQLGVILFFARILGRIAEKLKQPIIVGEITAGIILGPAVFGNQFPYLYKTLFPVTGYQPYILQGLSWLCVLFLLMITGLEIDFRSSIKQGRQSIYISLLALFSTFSAVFFFIQHLPENYYPQAGNPIYVNIFATIALSVIAIPVIAKILSDLKILHSGVGVNILTSGLLSDIWGWTLLAIIISIITTAEASFAGLIKPFLTIILYVVCVATIGHKLVNKLFHWFGYKDTHKELDITNTLAILFSLTLLNGAIAHMLGIHVIFGAFIAGIMAGESDKITSYLRQWTKDFIFAIFSPIFFVLVGMQLDFSFLNNTFPLITLLIISSVARILGAYSGAILGGIGKKNAFAVACGLNTQGTMGIIVALIGFEMGLFNKDMFSMIVSICVLTSLGVRPLLKWAIKGVQRPLAEYFDPAHVFLDIPGGTKKEVIKTMAYLMKDRKIIDNEKAIEDSIWNRESTLSTAIGEGVALPHARIPNLETPVLCFFRLKEPVDFESPDNKPVQILFLELTDYNDDGMHLNLISQVARFISIDKNREKLLECKKEENIHHILSFDEKA